MAKASHTLQKGAVVQHTAKAHDLKDQLPEGSILATTIRFVTLNCRTLSSELQQAALSRLLRYLCVPFAALQETRMRDRPVVSIENYTIYCGDADENKVGGCAIAVRNDYKNLVEEFGSTSSRCAFLRLRDRRGRKLWIVIAHAPTKTAEDNSKDAFYDELNALMSKIPSQQVVIVGIDANAKMGLEQQSDVLGKWYYAAERTSDNSDRLVDLCEQTGLIIASTFKRNHRRHQLTWQGSTLLTPEEQRKRKMRTLKLQLDYVLARNIPQSDIRKSRAVWDVAFDSDHRPVLLSFKVRFHKRNRGVPLQPKIDMAGLKDDECRRKFRQRVSIHVGVRTRKKLSDAHSFTKCIQDAARETLPVLLPRKNAGDFNQEKRLRRKLRRQLQQDRDNERTSRAMEFEKAWEDRNPRKAYALLKQYSGKMKRCSHVLNTANGVAVGEATLPIWKEHFKTLLNRLAPSAPELEHVHRPTYAVNEEPPTESEVLVCIQKMKNGKSGGDDGISAEMMLKYLPPSGIREMTKIIRSIWINERIPDSWRHANTISLHKKLSVTDPRNYRGISLLRVMYKVLERIILDRLIKHREETTRDEQAGFRPGRSTIDQVFIVRRVIEIWLRYSKTMQLAFLDFEAAFDSPHRGRLLNALRADGVPGKFVRLLDDMNQRTIAAVRTPAGCTTPFEVVIGVRQGAVAGPFLFNFAIDDIMRRTVGHCPADIVLAPSGCPLTDLEYADDVVIFAESSTKLQHVVTLVSKLAAAYGLRLRPDKCKQMWISSRPRTGIRVDGQPIELVDEFCYLCCMLTNNGSYERDVQQRCAKATSAFNSLTKCLWSTPITNEVKLRVYLSAIRPIMTDRRLGQHHQRVCHNEDLYAEIDAVYRRMTHGRYQHLAPPSKAAKVNRLRFFGHILRRPADRLVQRVLKSSSGSSWKKPPGRKRKFWTEVVKEDLRTLGLDRQFRRDVRFRKTWNSDEWIDSVQALAEDREGWAELRSRTAHLGEDAGLTFRQTRQLPHMQFLFQIPVLNDTAQCVDLIRLGDNLKERDGLPTPLVGGTGQLFSL
ncbi:hypothetical protein RB195_019611 [Necator americanus]|uniref:Reverse transcriptase domain-containing protein n=1 Tax=Necator americanus TaxID=51031 RepID=A0ABR1CII9_NECAM